MSAILVLSFCALVLLVGTLFVVRKIKGVQRVAKHLDQHAAKMADSSRHISNSGSELSTSFVQQSTAMQQTSAAIHEVSKVVTKSRDGANRAFEVASQSHTATERGKEAVAKLSVSMADISQRHQDIMKQIELNNSQLTDIVSVIFEIANKTKVINDIVFQTKLLSFNASIEAARAREHGKGFAVIADEVGKLAQMSGTAAKEISEILEHGTSRAQSIIQDTKAKIQHLITLGLEKIHDGTVHAERCDEILDEVVAHVQHFKKTVTEIATVSNEQSAVVHNINLAVEQTGQATKKNSWATKKIADSAQQLGHQAASVQRLAEDLRSTFGLVKRARIDTESKFEAPATRPVKPRFAHIAKLEKPVLHLTKSAVGSSQVPSQDDPRFEDS